MRNRKLFRYAILGLVTSVGVAQAVLPMNTMNSLVWAEADESNGPEKDVDAENEAKTGPGSVDESTANDGKEGGAAEGMDISKLDTNAAKEAAELTGSQPEVNEGGSESKEENTTVSKPEKEEKTEEKDESVNDGSENINENPTNETDAKNSNEGENEGDANQSNPKDDSSLNTDTSTTEDNTDNSSSEETNTNDDSNSEEEFITRKNSDESITVVLPKVGEIANLTFKADKVDDVDRIDSILEEVPDEKIKEELRDKKSENHIFIYDIGFMKGNTEVHHPYIGENNAVITINFDGEIDKVYHLSYDGISEIAGVRQEGNKVIFETDSFSNFILTAKAENENNEVDTEKSEGSSSSNSSDTNNTQNGNTSNGSKSENSSQTVSGDSKEGEGTNNSANEENSRPLPKTSVGGLGGTFAMLSVLATGIFANFRKKR